MTIMMDIIGAAILVGMLILTIMNVNINLGNENYRSICEFKTQTELIQLARIVEFDLYKAGYYVPTSMKPLIRIADTSKIKFATNLFNVPGAVDSVMYDLGGPVVNSTNPKDRILVRYENTTKVYINYSVVRFRLYYYNSKDSLLTAPVTGSWLDSIKSVKVSLSLESPEPFDTTRTGGGYPYVSATYQKLIYPRNL